MQYCPRMVDDRTNSRPGTGALLRLIRHRPALTRAELARLTGLSRATISQRVDALIDSGLVKEAGDLPSTGGRPPASLVFDSDLGLVLGADLGATHARLAAADLSGRVVAEVALDLAIADGPESVLDAVAARFSDLLREAGREPEEVQGIGVGVPGPVEFATGRPTSPPIMPGWDGYAIPAHLAAHFDVPIMVDNDVNLMAVGEHWSHRRSVDHLLFVKVGTGIGCGIVIEGSIYRGDQGGAGDIGHIRVPGHDEVVCECGNVGCLEAVAGGRALVRRARELGLEVHDSRDVVRLAHGQNIEIVRMIRESGRILGEVISGLVNAFNPRVIVIGGDVAEAQEQLFVGVREVVYQRATALGTRHLEVAGSRLGDRAGTSGAALLAIEHVLSDASIEAGWLGGRRSGGPQRARAVGPT